MMIKMLADGNKSSFSLSTLGLVNSTVDQTHQHLLLNTTFQGVAYEQKLTEGDENALAVMPVADC